MRLKVIKNGKQYRCDTCSNLVKDNEVRWLKISRDEQYHFCTWAHRQAYVTMRYNLPLFAATGDQMTGNVIPVKNPGGNS